MRSRFFFLDGASFRLRCASTGHSGIGNKIIFPVSYLDQRIGSRALIAPASHLPIFSRRSLIVDPLKSRGASECRVYSALSRPMSRTYQWRLSERPDGSQRGGIRGGTSNVACEARAEKEARSYGVGSMETIYGKRQRNIRKTA